MRDYECGTCGRAVPVVSCACGTTWPSARRSYGWLVAGLLLTPVSGAAAAGAWILAGRTVLERPHLGLASTATGAALVGLGALLALAGPAALSRAWSLFGRRRRARRASPPSTPRRAAAGVDATVARAATLRDRIPRGLARGLVAAGVGLWVVAFAASGALPRPLFVAATLSAWFAVPIGVVLDGDDRPGRRWAAALSLVPFAAAIVGAGYLVARGRRA